MSKEQQRQADAAGSGGQVWAADWNSESRRVLAPRPQQCSHGHRPAWVTLAPLHVSWRLTLSRHRDVGLGGDLSLGSTRGNGLRDCPVRGLDWSRPQLALCTRVHPSMDSGLPRSPVRDFCVCRPVCPLPSTPGLRPRCR